MRLLPPRAARALLDALTGPDADGAAQALDEMFRERAKRDGVPAARRWYWRQVLGFVVRWRAIGRGSGRRGVLDRWSADVRFALRGLGRAPGFTLIAVTTLALGIGANTAIFSLIEATLLRPLPYRQPSELVWLADGHPSFGGGGTNQSIPNLLDLRAGSRLLGASAIYRVLGGNLSTDDVAQRVPILVTSSEMMGVLGVAPRLGRDLRPEDDAVGAEPAALLTDGLWRASFGGDPAVVGRTALVDGRPVRIVGVLPRGFTFLEEPSLVLALQHVGAEFSRGSRGYNAVGRLAPGATLTGLRTELQGIFDRLVQDHPDANEGWFAVVEPLRERMVGRNRQSLLLLGGAVVLVLLMACVNVANLVLVRAERRHRELAVRYSLGATRSGLVSLFLAEGVILALVGGALGVGLAYGGVDVLVALYGDTLARADAVGIDRTVLGATLAISLAVGVAVGLAPLARVRPHHLQEHLREGGRGSSGRASRLGRILVVSEVALSVLVVAGAGLLANSVWRLQRVDLGVRAPDRVMTFGVTLPAATYPDAASLEGFVRTVRDRLAAAPGVEAVGFVNRLPLLGGDNTTVTAWGDPQRKADFTSIRMITPGFFDAVGVPLLQGRWLREDEFRGVTSSVVINRTLARALFGDEDPVGRRIDVGFTEDGLLVVGVCADLAGGNPDRPAPGAFYYPLSSLLTIWSAQPRSASDFFGVSAVVRTAGPPRALVPELRSAVAAADPRVPVSRLRTLQDVAVERLGTRRFALSLFGVFAGLALLLGALGVYGVLSYGVAQRSREMGMRMALGASRASVLGLVFGESLRLTGPGLLLGLIAAMASARVLGDLLYEVSPLDPVTYLAVATVLALVCAVATWLPARRATRVEPMASMRAE